MSITTLDTSIIDDIDPIPTVPRGGECKVDVTDYSVLCALSTLIKEQRITNYHLAKLSDEQITHKEIL